MEAQPNGELVPQGGGDSVPLTHSPLIVGRRDSCDVCLPFPTLSGKHCELTFKGGHWIVRDLDSTNGTQVNGMHVQKKILHSGDVIAFGSRNFTLQYTETGRVSNLNEFDEELEEVMSMSLLEKAGLSKPPRHRANPVLAPTDPAADFDDEQDEAAPVEPPAAPEAKPPEPAEPQPPASQDTPAPSSTPAP